jgi:hypothetical protein
MEKVLKQAPIGICDEKIKEIFDNNNGDINKTLMELWDIPIEIEKEKTKWDDIRDTCDAYDNEMNRLISNIKNSARNDNGNT